MSEAGSIQWKTLFFELVIVFIGLLAALQVDEYRDRKLFAAAQTRYLQRLHDDLAVYLDETRSTVEFLKETRDAVQYVWESLLAGAVIGGDTEKFEHGLIYIGHLPTNPLPRGAYDEMVASGMFSALESAELQQSISRLYSTHEFIETNFSWWRENFLHTERYLYEKVRFFDGEGEVILMNDTLAEPRRRVEYDIAELAADPVFRNGIYWARDVRSDWYEWVSLLRNHAEEVRSMLESELTE